jgi:tRNA (cytidine/uridine-2'-O-)-methyltransferase
MFNIVLVEPEIPQNTGNIGRLCLATDSTLHLVHPLGFKLYDPLLKRAGMDYWKKVRIVEHPSFKQFQEKADSARCFYCSTKATRPFWGVRYQPGDHLIFGRETKGLPDDLLKNNPDNCVTIPMLNPEARSLNLATAAAIILYEALRQNLNAG